MQQMSSFQDFAVYIQHFFNRLKPGLGDRCGAFLATLPGRLRHPSRRDVVRALAVPPALLVLYTVVLIPVTPSISDIRKAASEQPAQILSADGRKITEFKQSNRQWVALKEISPHVVKALIATEDHRFYDHFGLDWRRTASAMYYTLQGDRQGGSTLTQQLARNLYPEEIGRAASLTRKLKEAITALKIEAVYSKDEILETYLNTVPFLYNAFGIEMAARTYFDTSADDLDVLQSATLVGMLKGNSYYNPVLNPERAVQRRNIVLAQMVKRGQLDAAKFESLKQRPLRVEFERQSEPPGPAPHFAQQLRKWLIAWADRNDYNIYSDGLVVHTTLDYKLQVQANQAVARQGYQLQHLANAAWGKSAVWTPGNPLVESFMRDTAEYKAALDGGATPEQALKQLATDTAFMRELRRQKTTIQAGFLAVDPQNGQIKAWVGSRDFKDDAFDHVQQARRQPGSTFKPFVYGEAFRQGMSPDDTLVDEAVEIEVGGDEIWRPSDGKPPSGQPMRLADALAYSKNTITAQLMQEVGANKVVKLAQAMGIRHSELEAVPSLALGTSPVTLMEMVAAYGTIANGGRYFEPVMVTRIEDRNGKLIEEFAPADGEQALSKAVAYTLLDTMRGVINRGTGSAIRSRFGIRADVAGKTGTTQDNADGWFILMHPQLVAGAWVGFNDPRITLRSDYWGQGAHSALPIVAEVFRGALRMRVISDRVRFEPPEQGMMQRLWNRVTDWFGEWFEPSPTSAPKTIPAPSTASPQEADALQAVIDKIVEESQKEASTQPPETATAPSEEHRSPPP